MGSRLVLLISAALLLGALVFVATRRRSPPDARLPEPAAEEALAPAPGAAPVSEAAARPEKPTQPGPSAGSRPSAPAPEPSLARVPEEEPASEPQPAPSEDVPLEKLLTLPAKPGLPAAGLDVDRNPHLREGATPTEGARAAGGPGIRIENTKEQVGPAGQTSVKRTDASVGVPVGDSVQLRGGVAVERRRKESEDTKVQPSPTVGIEMHF